MSGSVSLAAKPTISTCSLALASFPFAKLRTVVFERVDLTDASFMEAQLDAVEFVDCKLAGVDFRGVKTKACAIRGASLEGILGVNSLRGITMPWPDVLHSAAALAAALGINVESE
ncbi:MAG: pentapeptide repeat-containing protein [Solirubrobacterales bacterium]|nr:pentapeptide repeat-containing protein [Solirubrobacterales bacterium]